jgi:hypothetical protein
MERDIGLSLCNTTTSEEHGTDPPSEAEVRVLVVRSDLHRVIAQPKLSGTRKEM